MCKIINFERAKEFILNDENCNKKIILQSISVRFLTNFFPEKLNPHKKI